jgi:tRNA U34 5-methylaminomethyl-2-thiouridine-forming methyltransferase MnmC
LEAGLRFICENTRHLTSGNDSLHLIEVGAGTLLNAAVSIDYAQKEQLKITYTGLERDPPGQNLLLDYLNVHPAKLRPGCWQDLILMYPDLLNNQPRYWGQQELRIHRMDARYWTGPVQKAHVLYFDAFSPEAQPDMWDSEFLGKVIQWIRPGGCLVTYCVKGEVRRRFLDLDCRVEKLPGPPGKREMLRVHKPI